MQSSGLSGRRLQVGRICTCAKRLRLWVRAVNRSSWADALIAAGREAVAPDLCEVRACQLVRPSRRVAVAGQIEGLVEMVGTTSQSSGPGTVWQVDVRTREIQAAAPALLALAAALRSAGPVGARGVAMAIVLVRDGDSPLYERHGPDDIVQAVTAARSALGLNAPDR